MAYKREMYILNLALKIAREATTLRIVAAAESGDELDRRELHLRSRRRLGECSEVVRRRSAGDAQRQRQLPGTERRRRSARQLPEPHYQLTAAATRLLEYVTHNVTCAKGQQ